MGGCMHDVLLLEDGERTGREASCAAAVTSEVAAAAVSAAGGSAVTDRRAMRALQMSTAWRACVRASSGASRKCSVSAAL